MRGYPCISDATLAGLCAWALMSAVPATASPARSQPVSPNVFGSVALPVDHSRYSSRWLRVAERTRSPVLDSLVKPASGLDRPKKALFVNAALNQRLTYRFDTHPSGDHWASAAETLARSAGDCEDFVIAKMQALRALGVPTQDLYMTIGTDAASGAVHAVLLVRDGSGFWVLDNRSDRLFAQQAYRGFYPILTFSGNQTWLHGYRKGSTPPAVRALDAVRIAQMQNLPVGSSRGSAIKIAAGR